MSIDQTSCTFEHPILVALESAIFRLTEGDQVPALAIPLDDTEAVVPLEAVIKLFGIKRDSADGRLLGLIGQGLRFKPTMRMGDALPSEVLTGEASWEVAPYHRQVASARLQIQLLNWIGGAGEERQITSQMLVVSVEDPSIRPRVQRALRQAAAELGISGGPAVAALLEELAGETAYIEALRDRLLVRTQTLVRRFVRLGQECGGLAAARRETLFQVLRLGGTGMSQIAARFDQVDGQIGEILSALRNLDQQRSFLRQHRDWLYCALMQWEPMLEEWEAIPGVPDDEKLWRMLDRAYRFLAPRFMAVQEWLAPGNVRPAAEKAKPLVW